MCRCCSGRSRSHLHVGKDVATIDVLDASDRPLDLGRLARRARRLLRGRNPAARGKSPRRRPPPTGSSPFNAFTASRWMNGRVVGIVAARHRFVDRPLGRRRNRMARTIVAVGAVHPAAFTLRHCSGVAPGDVLADCRLRSVTERTESPAVRSSVAMNSIVVPGSCASECRDRRQPSSPPPTCS